MYRVEVHKLPIAVKVGEKLEETYSNSDVEVEALKTYVESGFARYTMVRMKYEAKCDEGINWTVRLYANLTKIYEKSGTNTDWQTFDTGWLKLPSGTVYLRVTIEGYYEEWQIDGTEVVTDTGRVRNIRIFCL